VAPTGSGGFWTVNGPRSSPTQADRREAGGAYAAKTWGVSKAAVAKDPCARLGFGRNDPCHGAVAATVLIVSQPSARRDRVRTTWCGAALRGRGAVDSRFKPDLAYRGCESGRARPRLAVERAVGSSGLRGTASRPGQPAGGPGRPRADARGSFATSPAATGSGRGSPRAAASTPGRATCGDSPQGPGRLRAGHLAGT
jgi:hypothetical protein